MASALVKEFTEENFETEVLQSSQPVLVDFWAEWCQPCRALAPMIEKLAKDYEGRVKVGKVDTDAAGQIAMRYSISSIPTVIVLQNGQPVRSIVGLRNERAYKEALDETLAAQ